MVESLKDIEEVYEILDKLEALGVPQSTTLNARLWLAKQAAKLVESAQKRA